MKSMSGVSLGLFAKYPEPGRVKTRLIPLLGEQGAAQFARWLLLNAVRKTSAFCAPGTTVRINLWTDGGNETLWRRLLSPLNLPVDLCFHPQIQGHLGERMHHATRIQLDESGVSMLLGPDAVRFSQQDFVSLLAAVQQSGLAFTPADDGGYVALACRRLVDCIFSGNIVWGSAQVAQQTRTLLGNAQESALWLPSQPDIDEPADLQQALKVGLVPSDWASEYSDEA